MIFFKMNQDTFDIIFIDGLHEANQVFRDVQNSLKYLNPNGTIVMHDCSPRGYKNSAIYPMLDTMIPWCGDTWKAVVALRMMKEIEIIVIDIDFGVGVIRRRPNLHPLEEKWQKYLSVNPISMLDYNHFIHHKEELLRLVSLQEFESWLNSEHSVGIIASGASQSS
jgi:hypothetical protein